MHVHFPDGKTMYLPSGKGFLECGGLKMEIITTIQVHSRAATPSTALGQAGHGRYRLLGCMWPTRPGMQWPSRWGLQRRHSPLSINSQETRVFATVNDLLGFEVGDLVSGEKLASIQVLGWDKGPVRPWLSRSWNRPDPERKEVWVCDGHNMRLHVFKAHPPFQQLTTIALDDMPGWVTFSMDGQYAWPSSGEVLHAKRRDPDPAQG